MLNLDTRSPDRFPVSMHAVEVAVIDRAVCRETYGTDFDSAAMLCAGDLNGGTGVCTGDQGGPLVVETLDGAVQHGIVSGSLGCGAPDLPSLAVDVAALGDWLQRIAGLGDPTCDGLVPTHLGTPGTDTTHCQ